MQINEAVRLTDPPPPDCSLYVCHFDQEIQESFLLRTFGLAGSICQTHIGKFKPRASKKKAKRTVYFAIVVFKSSESLAKLTSASESSYLQAKVNSAAQKQMRFSENPFLKTAFNIIPDGAEESSEDEETKAKKVQRAEMEADGFTMVTAATESQANRVKARDDLATTVIGVSADEAQRLYEE